MKPNLPKPEINITRKLQNDIPSENGGKNYWHIVSTSNSAVHKKNNTSWPSGVYSRNAGLV